MSYIPREVPEGAIRYNTDSNKMEVYIGSVWMEVAVSSPNLDGGSRGLFMGGATPSQVTPIDFITISTFGNAQDFGDRTQSGEGGHFASRTRAVCGGASAPTYVNTVDFVTMSSTGNGVDFGDVNYLNRQEGGGTSSCIKGIFAGGYSPAVNTISQVAIPTTGDAVDFGDLTAARAAAAASNCHGGLG